MVKYRFMRMCGLATVASPALKRTSPLTALVNRQSLLKTVLPGGMFEDDVMELLQLARAA